MSITQPVAREVARRVCAALAENPIVPTREQMRSISDAVNREFADADTEMIECMEDLCIEWQRRCFLAADVPQCQEIQLTKGQVALVDPEDFERLNLVKWYARQSGSTYYAERHVKLENGLRGVSSIHREVIGAEPGEFVDHVDRNGLNNRKVNLRRCSEDQNKQNVGLHSDKQTSKYKGVCHSEAKGKYIARIGYEGAMHHIGYFDVEEDAAMAYDREARIHHGEFAYLNFPDNTRMFLAPEPEVPETEREIIDGWLKRHQPNGSRISLVGDAMASELLRELEAFHRGQKSKENQ